MPSMSDNGKRYIGRTLENRRAFPALWVLGLERSAYNTWVRIPNCVIPHHVLRVR